MNIIFEKIMKLKRVDKNIYFSVVIPTYNRRAELAELLLCLKQQTYKNFEVLICDDGSTDNSSELVANYKEELDIKYFKLNNSGGPATPRNFGIENAKYEWICFVDSDDMWTINKLQILANYIISNPKFKIFCHPVFILEDKNVKSKIIGKYKKGIFLNDFKSLLYNGSQIVNSSLCVCRNIISNELIFNTSPDYHGIEDYIFLLNLTERNYSIKNINIPLGFYRIHNNNISGDSKKQINKLKKFFTNITYNNTNNNKINSLINYLEISTEDLNLKSLIKAYLRIIIAKSSLELKLKSFSKIILNIVK